MFLCRLVFNVGPYSFETKEILAKSFLFFIFLFFPFLLFLCYPICMICSQHACSPSSCSLLFLDIPLARIFVPPIRLIVKQDARRTTTTTTTTTPTTWVSPGVVVQRQQEEEGVPGPEYRLEKPFQNTRDMREQSSSYKSWNWPVLYYFLAANRAGPSL